jgi:hypothetical protein
MRSTQYPWTFTLAAVLGLAATSPAARGELVDNFLYDAWAKFPVGASVTLKDTLEIKISELNQTNTMETTSTFLLKAITPERVELEVTQVMQEQYRQPRRLPTQRMVVPAKVERGQEVISMKIDGARPIKQVVSKSTEKHEKTDIAGVRVDAILREYTITGDQASGSRVKAWYVPEVPGGVAKVESRTEGAVQSVTRLTLVEFKPAPGQVGRLDLVPGATTQAYESSVTGMPPARNNNNNRPNPGAQGNNNRNNPGAQANNGNNNANNGRANAGGQNGGRGAGRGANNARGRGPNGGNGGNANNNGNNANNANGQSNGPGQPGGATAETDDDGGDGN